MVFLNAFGFCGAASVCLDSARGCERACDCCDIRDSVFDGGFADIGVIEFALLAGGCVYDQMDLPVFDGVRNVGASFVHFQDGLGGDVILFERFMRSARGEDFESEPVVFGGDFEEVLLVAVGDGNQRGSFQREGLLRRFLRLEISEPE